MFTHSAVPALNQLMLPFLSLVSVAELQRNPTVKDEASGGDHLDQRPAAHLPGPPGRRHPVLQGNVVPVGRDQLPHLEQTRVVARRFNERYARASPSPGPCCRRPMILGTDGTKMSKSGQRDRAADDRGRDGQEAQGREDRQRPGHHLGPRAPSRGGQPAHPDRRMCEGVEPAPSPRRSATWRRRAEGASPRRSTPSFAPLRARRTELEAEPAYLGDVLRRGNARANEVAEATLDEVRAAMGMICL